MTCEEARELAPAYVLGALEADELAAVREHLASCGEAHEEFAALGAVAIALVETVELVEPPPALRERVMAAARRDLEERTGALTAPLPAPVPAVRPTARPAAVEAPPPGTWFDRLFGGSRGAWALRAAAVVAIIGLIGWNFVLQNDLTRTRTYQERLDGALALASLPGSQVAVLGPTEGSAGGHGIAVMPATGEGQLVVSGLRPTAGQQAYVAWAIHDGEAPIPLGGFRVGSDGVGYLDRMPPADTQRVTVALTLEPNPNATAPSTPPVSVGVADPATASLRVRPGSGLVARLDLGGGDPARSV